MAGWACGFRYPSCGHEDEAAREPPEVSSSSLKCVLCSRVSICVRMCVTSYGGIDREAEVNGFAFIVKVQLTKHLYDVSSYTRHASGGQR